MLFSSNIFLYVFFPLVLVCYFSVYLLGGKRIALSNAVLLVFSLFFYFWGSGRYFLLLLVSILGNYLFGRLVHAGPWPKAFLAAATVFNLGLLLYFKYFNFFYNSSAGLYTLLSGRAAPQISQIFLPIGISFYTFQALSYVIDVYRGTVSVQKNPFKLALFISFFPQLIAGPIVRYSVVEQEIDTRSSTFNEAYLGACRFCLGLGKKVALADTVGPVADKIFALPMGQLSTPLAWTGLLLYFLQIYLDFSAYSDMAIGMAHIFGFHFHENFLLPYSSKNITEFWRRWHISLSSFFRDYLYIPLGGNRKGQLRTYLNLWVVFLLCGLWHGANWTFVVWGAYHGVLLVVERFLLHRFGFKMRGAWGQAVTLLLVMLGWLIFRSPSVDFALQYAGVLFGGQQLSGFQYYTYGYYMHTKIIVATIFSLTISIFPLARLARRFRGTALHGAAALLALGVSMLLLSDASFNPFIYFQF